MLVLTRHPGEETIINGTIRLTVVSVKGDRIRLGIDAPPSVVVDRQEIHERRLHDPNSVTGPSCGGGPAEKEIPQQLVVPVLR